MDTPSDSPVVVGVTDKHPAVLDFARTEAQRGECGLHLVRAYTVPPSAMSSVYGLDVPGSFRAGGREVLNEARRHLRSDAPGPPITSALRRGSATTVLESEAEHARIMVIGQDESRPWPVRIFEGRVAHHLVENAVCPVVVVPDSWTAAQDAGPVVVMVDGESSAHGPLAYAFSTASRRHVELQVLHVEPEPAGEPRAEWQTIRRVVDAWFERHPHVRGSSRVVAGDVRTSAVDAASMAGLLVLGRPHERGLAGRAVDSLAQEVITAAGCPVAVVPASYG